MADMRQRRYYGIVLLVIMALAPFLMGYISVSTGGGGASNLDEAFDAGGTIDGATSAKKFCVGDGTRSLCWYGDPTDGMVAEVSPAQDHNIDIGDNLDFNIRDSSGATTWMNLDEATGRMQAGYGIITASKAANYTIGTDDAREAYGGVIYVSSAATITAPAVVDGMNFSVITTAAVAVSIDVDAADRMILDGAALDDGDKATSGSTAGEMIVCTYESASGFACQSDGWTDGGA